MLDEMSLTGLALRPVLVTNQVSESYSLLCK